MNAIPPFDPQMFKTATREQWNKSAQGWDDQGAVIHAWLEQATTAMLDMADVKTGARVLDVAAGAGDQTLAAAARVGPKGQVLATDLSPAILEFAAANAARAGFANITTKTADGEHLDVEAASFDAAICRLGLMFYPDPLQGLREMHAALKPGGKACSMVFAAPDRNPCLVILISTAFKHAGLPPRDPFQPGGLMSLGKPGMIDALFAQAGFSEVATRSVAAPFQLASVDQYLDFIRTSAGPILQIIGRLEPAQQEAAWAEITEKLSAFNTPTGWEGPNELLLTAGRR